LNDEKYEIREGVQTDMTETLSDIDISTIKNDIHGERVANTPACDYCGAELNTEEPVMYDVIRVADMPNLERVFDLPSGWFPDAIRCQQCERDTLSPGTDGFDEGLLIIHLSESNGILSIDSSSIAPVDFSLVGQGYYPPHVSPQMVSQFSDLGLARWIRVKWLLEHDESSQLVSIVRKGVEESKEIPPEV